MGTKIGRSDEGLNARNAGLTFFCLNLLTLWLIIWFLTDAAQFRLKTQSPIFWCMDNLTVKRFSGFLKVRGWCGVHVRPVVDWCVYVCVFVCVCVGRVWSLPVKFKMPGR